MSTLGVLNDLWDRHFRHFRKPASLLVKTIIEEEKEPIKVNRSAKPPGDHRVGRPYRSRAVEAFSPSDLVNANEIIHRGATVPPPCNCGALDYFFYIDHRDRLTGECRRCHSKRYYSSSAHLWGPFPKGYKPQEQ